MEELLPYMDQMIEAVKAASPEVWAAATQRVLAGADVMLVVSVVSAVVFVLGVLSIIRALADTVDGEPFFMLGCGAVTAGAVCGAKASHEYWVATHATAWEAIQLIAGAVKP